MTIALALSAPGAKLSPDGYEMLAVARGWFGLGPNVSDPGYWPPLWALLSAPGAALGQGALSMYLLNLLFVGLTVVPLHALTRNLAGPLAARVAVLIFASLPQVRDHAVVLDARPLGMLVATLCLAWALEAANNHRSWVWPFAAAAIATLVRPEGILLPPLVALGVMIANRNWKVALVGLFMSLAPLDVLSITTRGVGNYEAFIGPWIQIWPLSDLVALYGPASVATPYRAFVQQAVALGIEQSPRPILELLGLIPLSIVRTMAGLATALGVLGMLALLWGLLSTMRRSRRACVGTLVGLVPFGVIAIAPMARGQASIAANLLFMVPAACAILAAGLLRPGAKIAPGGQRRGQGGGSIQARRQWRRLRQHRRWIRPAAGLALTFGVIAETNIGPLREPPPYFLETAEAAQLAVAQLRRSPPAGGVVATGLPGRSVVLRAGLQRQTLPPGWLEWDPPDGVPVLVSNVETNGEDGGRARTLIESPDWRVLWVVADGEMSEMSGQKPERERQIRGWFALLEPVER